MADGANQFRVKVDEFSTTYKGLDHTYDTLDGQITKVVAQAASVNPDAAGGDILGVVAGVQAGQERAHGAGAGNMHHALGALRNRTGHLLNGMHASLNAYHQEDELHAGVYAGTEVDPATDDIRSKSYTSATTDPKNLPPSLTDPKTNKHGG